ncbi:MAG: glycoside hydrolase family 125 protein, partial [Burkholderiaceae bacterium]
MLCFAMHLPQLHDRIVQAARRLPADAALQAQFTTCALNTIETTTERLEDGSTFVFTGDIPALWLRDSSAQVRHYLLLAADVPEVQ